MGSTRHFQTHPNTLWLVMVNNKLTLDSPPLKGFLPSDLPSHEAKHIVAYPQGVFPNVHKIGELSLE